MEHRLFARRFLLLIALVGVLLGALSGSASDRAPERDLMPNGLAAMQQMAVGDSRFVAPTNDTSVHQDGDMVFFAWPMDPGGMCFGYYSAAVHGLSCWPTQPSAPTPVALHSLSAQPLEGGRVLYLFLSFHAAVRSMTCDGGGLDITDVGTFNGQTVTAVKARGWLTGAVRAELLPSDGGVSVPVDVNMIRVVDQTGRRC